MTRRLSIFFCLVASAFLSGCGFIPSSWLWPSGQQKQEYAVMKPLAAGAATIPPEVLGPIKRRMAIVVGISDYAKASAGGIQNLKYAAEDADAFRVHLMNSGFNTVRVLTDEDASVDAIRKALTELVASADKDDFVMISWAGHCVADPQSGQLFLLAHDSRLDRLADSAYSLADFRRDVASGKTDRLLVILDACHAGAVAGGDSPAQRQEEMTDVLAAMRGVYIDHLPAETKDGGKTPIALSREWVEARGVRMRLVFASSQCGEPSLESEAFQHGVFSYYLLKGMQGEADSDGDGVVTVSELVKYTGDMVRSATKNRQNPAICGAFDGTVPVGISKGRGQ